MKGGRYFWSAASTPFILTSAKPQLLSIVRSLARATKRRKPRWRQLPLRRAYKNPYAPMQNACTLSQSGGVGARLSVVSGLEFTIVSRRPGRDPNALDCDLRHRCGDSILCSTMRDF